MPLTELGIQQCGFLDAPIAVSERWVIISLQSPIEQR